MTKEQEAAWPTIKRRTFRYDRDQTPMRHWLGGDPVATSFFNSLSVVFPKGEAFFIECIRPWQRRAGEKLDVEIREFIRQEALHGREHVAFNRGIIAGGYDVSALEAVVDDVIDAVRGKHAIARLTYTMCFEHLTAILSSATLKNEAMMERAEPEMRRIWSWHAVEEIEHKGVCFDTWMLATEDWSPARRYWTRCLALALISVGFVKNRIRGQIHLLRQDGWSARKSLPAILRCAFGKNGLGRAALGDWIKFFKPGFHPWQIDDRDLIPMGESVFADAASPAPAAQPVKEHEPQQIAHAA
tara:strand:- start:108 stop:1007 length:900 start_codon:yes stop_codon:yes gene_type:complete